MGLVDVFKPNEPLTYMHIHNLTSLLPAMLRPSPPDGSPFAYAPSRALSKITDVPWRCVQ